MTVLLVWAFIAIIIGYGTYKSAVPTADALTQFIKTKNQINEYNIPQSLLYRIHLVLRIFLALFSCYCISISWYITGNTVLACVALILIVMHLYFNVQYVKSLIYVKTPCDIKEAYNTLSYTVSHIMFNYLIAACIIYVTYTTFIKM